MKTDTPATVMMFGALNAVQQDNFQSMTKMTLIPFSIGSNDMAWNPSPQVASARDFAKKFDKKIVVIMHVDDKGRLGYASYGETKLLCDAAKILADKAFDSIVEE